MPRGGCRVRRLSKEARSSWGNQVCRGWKTAEDAGSGRRLAKAAGTAKRKSPAMQRHGRIIFSSHRMGRMRNVFYCRDMSPGRTGGLRAHRVDGVCGPFAAPSDGAMQVAANRRMIDMRRVTAPARTHPMNPFRKAAKPELPGCERSSCRCSRARSRAPAPQADERTRRRRPRALARARMRSSRIDPRERPNAAPRGADAGLIDEAARAPRVRTAGAHEVAACTLQPANSAFSARYSRR